MWVLSFAFISSRTLFLLLLLFYSYYSFYIFSAHRAVFSPWRHWSVFNSPHSRISSTFFFFINGHCVEHLRLPTLCFAVPCCAMLCLFFFLWAIQFLWRKNIFFYLVVFSVCCWLQSFQTHISSFLLPCLFQGYRFIGNSAMLMLRRRLK